MNAFDLSGKTFLITGSSSGIGRQTAITISEYGGQLIITGRNKERLNNTLLELKGDNHVKISADLSKPEDIDELINDVPQMNGIIHCAGITSHIPSQFIKPKHISQIFKVNYEAPVLITSKILKQKKLLKNSSILFISSITTKQPYFGGSIYVSSKSAIEGYSNVLSIELATKGIRSNCISPGYIKTAMIEESEATVSKEVMDKIEKGQLLGAGETNDVANAIIYFLSDASKWVTGTNLVLGG